MPGQKLGAGGSILVIDIGTSSLKLLDIDTSRGKPILRKFHIEEFPPEIQEKPFPEKELLTQCLKEALTKSEIKTKAVIFILPDSITDLVLLTLPKQTKEELKTSLKWELKDRISFPVEEAVFDYYTTWEFKEADVAKMTLLVTAVSRNEIKKYLQLLTELGLEPVSFSIGFMSFWPIIKKSGLIEKDEEAAIIDFGAKTTKLGIFKGDYLELYRKIDLGGRQITLALMNEATDFQKAEDIKRDVGVSALDMEKEGVDSSITEIAQRNFGLTRPILERLTSEINQNFSFYKESLKGGQIKKLFMFGGGGKLKGLKTFISSTLETNTFSPDPFTELETEGIDKTQLQEESLVLARAWGAFIVGTKGINLLPEEIKFKRKIRRKHEFVRLSACIAVAVLALVYASVGLKGKVLSKRILIKEQEYENLGQSVDRMNQLDIDKSLLQKKMDLCVELLSEDPFWDDILKEIGRLIPRNIILNKIKIQKADAAKEEEFTEITTKPKEGIILTLEGSVYPSELTLERSLTSFLNILSESPNFYETKLNITKENKADDKMVLDFVIQSQIHPPQNKAEEKQES